MPCAARSPSSELQHAGFHPRDRRRGDRRVGPGRVHPRLRQGRQDARHASWTARPAAATEHERRHVPTRIAARPALPRHRRRHRPGPRDGRGLPARWAPTSRSADAARPSATRLRRPGERTFRAGASTPSASTSAMAQARRRDGRGAVAERWPHRPGQQRRRQLHRAHREPVAARLRRHREHRLPRQLLRHAGGGQALGRPRPRRARWQPGQAVPQRHEHHRHLGRQRQPLRGAVGDEQGRHRRDDEDAGGGVGEVRRPAQRHRPGRDPDRRHEQAAQSRARNPACAAGEHNPMARPGEMRRTAESGHFPDGARPLRLAHRPEHHDGRRQRAGHRRQLLRTARVERRRLAGRARAHRGAERPRPRGAFEAGGRGAGARRPALRWRLHPRRAARDEHLRPAPRQERGQLRRASAGELRRAQRRGLRRPAGRGARRAPLHLGADARALGAAGGRAARRWASAAAAPSA